MSSIYTTFFIIVFLLIGTFLVFTLPILLGVALRATFRKVNTDLVSLLGGTITLLFMTVALGYNKILDEVITSTLLTIGQFGPAPAVLMVFLVMLSSMAFPFFMVRIGVNMLDRFKKKRENPGQCAEGDSSIRADAGLEPPQH